MKTNISKIYIYINTHTRSFVLKADNLMFVLGNIRRRDRSELKLPPAPMRVGLWYIFLN